VFRIVIASADLALARGEVSEALDLLKDIRDDHPYYIQAKEKMANIYLKMRYEHISLSIYMHEFWNYSHKSFYLCYDVIIFIGEISSSFFDIFGFRIFIKRM